MNDRHLYLRANDLARALGERWKLHLAQRKVAHREEARAQLRAVYPEFQNAGRQFNLAALRQVVPGFVLSAVEGMFGSIQEVRDGSG